VERRMPGSEQPVEIAAAPTPNDVHPHVEGARHLANRVEGDLNEMPRRAQRDRVVASLAGS
jgi:lysophospholipase L1-like esterase